VETRPKWLRVKAPTPEQAEQMRQVRDILDTHQLNTVCQGAMCPNAVACWGAGTATFMILGDVCTRACRFCGVRTGDPEGHIDRSEAERIGRAAKALGLRYVVMTSVDRDDLPDGGSGVFVQTVVALRASVPEARIELLIPDFMGDPLALSRVLSSRPDVIGHNLETVPSLTPSLRDRRASYEQSMAVLEYLRNSPEEKRAWVKTGLMLGLGETRTELKRTFEELAEIGIDALTLGQYLRPTSSSVPVKRLVPPEEFDALADEARSAGIERVISGPLVRSSFMAAELFEDECD